MPHIPGDEPPGAPSEARRSTLTAPALLDGNANPLPTGLTEALLALPAHIALLDAESTIRWTNAAWNEFARANAFQAACFGVGDSYLRTCEQVTGECREQALEVASGLRAVLARQTGQFTLDYPCHSPLEHRWFQVSVTPVAGGGALVAHTNVTRIKLAEILLRESEERYRTLASVAPVGEFRVDRAGRCTYVNERWCELTGRSAAEAIGTVWFETLESADAARVSARWAAALEAGDPLHTEFRIRRPDGTKRWCFGETRVVQAANGEIDGYVGAITDVTDLKLAEQALRANEERFRALIERSSDLLAVLDVEGRIVFVSPSSATALGSTTERVLGRNVFELLYPSDEPALRKVFNEIVAEPGAVRRVELKLRHSNHTWRVLDTVLRNLKDLPSVGGIVANARDVTDERRLESELAEARKMEALGRLAGGIAHEFNNLLTVIKGYSDLVLSDLEEDSPLRSDMTAIAQAGERAASITRQLLQFARRHAASPMVLDVSASLRHVQSFLKPLLRENISVEFRIARGLWPVHFDPAELEQVLVNLAVNARDAMPFGGRLVVEAHNEPVGTVGRPGDPTSQSVDHVVISVSDTGVGMTEEVAQHVFEPFFTTKGPGRGTGLGLPTSLGIVEQHGGRLRFYSEPGHGTTFTLSIPRALGTPAELEVAEPAVPDGAHELLLVVEDDPAVRSYTVQVLRKRGYQVFEAGEGAEALMLAEQLPRPADLLITDVVMPDMNGAEVAAMLSQRWAGLRVLFVSGYPADAAPVEGLVAAEEAFLAKPYTPETLATKVRALLDLPASGYIG